jgi:hypothetical protein
MPRYVYLLSLIFLCLAASMTLACGANPQREIESLNVTPASGEGPQVQFTATGTFNTPPVTVSPLQATWVVTEVSGLATNEVSITTSGLAQCTSGASGTYTVAAWTLQLNPSKGTCNVIGPYGDPCGSILGTAQLTCP